MCIRDSDCAVLGVSGPLCVSTDLFMEDVHFRRSYFTPEDIGWKALAVNLSDLAADGARPMGFTVGLSLPPDADMALVDGLCAGMAELAAQASVPLVGGDLSRADKLHLCLTAVSYTHLDVYKRQALYFSREPIPSRRKGTPHVPMHKQVCIIPFRRDYLLKFNAMDECPLEIIESVDMMRILEHGEKVRMVPTDKRTLSVDTQEDLERVREMMRDDALRISYTK